MSHPILVPPHSEQAEQAVLGAILQRNDLFDDVAELINQEDFYIRAHRVIFEAISQEVKKGRPADVVTIGSKPDIEMSYCVSLARNCPASKNAAVYASSIKKKSVQRMLIGACNEIQDASFSHVESVNDLVGNAERLISNVTDNLTKNTKDNSAGAILGISIKYLEFMSKSKKEIIGQSTGIYDLDIKINGLKDSTLVIVAARPSMGKTTISFQMCCQIALAGGYPLVFSLETAAELLMLKAISNIGGIDFGALQKAKLDDHGWEKVGQASKALKASNLEIIDDSSMTTAQIRLDCRRYKKKYKHNPTVIMIDYIQLIRGINPENRTQEISQISRDLKDLCKESKCPVIGLSQLSRDVEKRADKRPINSDLRESGQLEQDADEIIFIYRDEVYNENSTDKGKAELIVGKSKMNTIGTVVTRFVGEYQRFMESNDQRVTSKQSSSNPYVKKFKRSDG